MWLVYTKRVARPVTSTWALWFGIGLLLFFASMKAGAKWDSTLVPIFMGVVNPGIILLLSLRFGEYSWTKLDSVCVFSCVVAIIVWQLTDNPVLGIVGGIAADFLAALPQLLKAWRDPLDEPVFPWSMFALASAVSIFAIDEWVVGKWLFPIYMTVMSILLTIPLVVARYRT